MAGGEEEGGDTRLDPSPADLAAPLVHPRRGGACSVCEGPAWGGTVCPRTGARLCSKACVQHHQETRLLKLGGGSA